jgi:aspartate/methionine/tyrosine aminotransferase
MKSPIRPAIERLEPNGIGLVAMMALGDPDLIPLWFGESDLVTPGFIRDAAKKALDDGKTFYSSSRGIYLSAKRSAIFISVRSVPTSAWNGFRCRARRRWQS